MKTVHEVSMLTGVSVRTLHHYDAIGLLKPTALTDAGYRLYDDAALARLQTVLLFRELAFPLAEIRTILDSPGFDLKEALKDHIALLKLQKERLDGLIVLADTMMNKGVNTLNFKAFDNKKAEELSKEVKEKWGNTAAYREFAEKDAAKEPGSRQSDTDALMEQFVRFGSLKNLSPDSPEVTGQVKALQQFITDRFYTCTDEILAGLGEMYVADERFRNNIDRAGGEGTAEFVACAIRHACGK